MYVNVKLKLIFYQDENNAVIFMVSDLDESYSIIYKRDGPSGLTYVNSL